jgi:hypothetical protein
MRLEANPGKQIMRPHLQNNRRKMDWRCGSGVELLLCKCKSLNSNTSSTKKKKKKQNPIKLPKGKLSRNNRKKEENERNPMWR